MSAPRVLILGGTAEARELAGALDAAGLPAISSLAGRVARPRLPAGEVRIGGFGGPEGLARWLGEHGTAAVVDATHPFAVRISASAAQACPQAGVPLLRLERPGWQERPGDDWLRVATAAQAAGAIEPGRRVLLTLGRQELAAFAQVAGAFFLVRSVEWPDEPLPPRHVILLDRGPFTREGELALLDEHAIDLLVTRDSGGPATAPKLDAARQRGVAVVVIERPPAPPGPAVATVAEALAWARARLEG